MENDSVRSSGTSTLVDLWIDGKLRAISVSREAIEGFLHLTPERAAAMTEVERSEFVRTHLTQVITAATAKLRNTEGDADAVAIEEGDLGGRAPRRPPPPDGERRSTDRRKGDRRKVNLSQASAGHQVGVRQVTNRVCVGSSGWIRTSNPPVNRLVQDTIAWILRGFSSTSTMLLPGVREPIDRD